MIGDPPAAVLDRRAFTAFVLTLPIAGRASAARLAPAGLNVKSSAIHWPVEGIAEVHGFMAVPDRARGRQPAVLIVGDRGTEGDLLRATTIAVAQAGFVGCAPTHGAGTLTDAAITTELKGSARWLATNRYATGSVGAIGFGAGADLCAQLAANGDVAAAILFGARRPVGGPALLSFEVDGSGGWHAAASPSAAEAFAPDWASVWSQATTFLREHLL